MLKRTLLLVGIAALVATSAAFATKIRSYDWQLTPTGSTARLRGLSVVSDKVVWTSGSLGTVLRTTNGGQTWQSVGPPGTSTLQFRDIEAFDEDHAVILSIGNGTDSRIYVTSDGGATWTQTFTNTDPNAFYDCMTFFDKRHGLANSDPVNGKFRIISTSDGGASWTVVPDAGMPAALPGEAGFAASGQCLTSHGGKHAWLGSGGGAQARVFSSKDGGISWQVSATPLNSGPTSGVFALAFRNDKHGIAVGGDFAAPTASPNSRAWTRDGGKTWTLASGPTEYRSGATYVKDHTAIAVGPSGSDVSTDDGHSWTKFDDGSFDTVDCAGGGKCWASGEQGRVAHLTQSH